MSRATTPPAATVQLPQRTPVAVKSSTTNSYTSSNHTREQHKRRLDSEMKGRFVGPMPPSVFLKRFLPVTNLGRRPRMNGKLFGNVAKMKSETEMYGPLIEALKKYCPSLELFDSHSHTDRDCGIASYQTAPDISVYQPGSGVTKEKPTQFSKMEMHIEVKKSVASDGFQDPKSDTTLKSRKEFDFERESIDSSETRGQIIAYALSQLGMQFRTFAFSVIVCGPIARLIRWDRAGAIVSSAFDYSKETYLVEFFWKYNALSSEQRGHDMTVSTPTDIEISKAAKGLECPKKSTLVKFTISTEGEPDAYYVGGRPVFDARSLIGRATRCFVVWDLQKSRVVYLKDTWRIDLPDIQPEGEIYEILHENEVKNIAPLERAGDVSTDHVTVTQSMREEGWACKTVEFVGHKHYRIVLGVIGRSLTSFASTHEFITAMKDAMIAHKDAFEKAKVIHRDISVGNILITQDGKGLLIDWDLSKKVDSDTKPRQRQRTGTWQFMSADLLLNPEKTHDLQDDLESFLHVITWVAIRYCKSDLTATGRAELLYQVFDYVVNWEDGSSFQDCRGGEAKKYALMYGRISKVKFQYRIPGNPQPSFHEHKPLREIITSITQTFGVRYEDRPPDQQYEDLKMYREVLSQTSSERIRDVMNRSIANSAAAKYEELESRMANHTWVIEEISNKLDINGWPQHDESETQEMPKGR